MLANLDNEVHFKRVFTDVEVFTAFVHDVLGIHLKVDRVETEKVLPGKVGAIKFRMDIFAEDDAQRTVVEIQKVDYDYAYDRFTHYFLGNLIDLQRSSKTYAFAKDVYLIVVVTAAYRISDKNGRAIKDDILITDINPRSRQGELRDMFNHKMVILNTTNVGADTPPAIRDWLELITQSIQSPEHPHLNLSNPGVARAALLAELDNITPEELAEAKEQEMRKVAFAQIEAETDRRRILQALKRGKLTHEEIAEDFEVSVEYVKRVGEEAGY